MAWYGTPVIAGEEEGVLLEEALQHTATHCNTLQHTATHCNTLQHTWHGMPPLYPIPAFILPRPANCTLFCLQVLCLFRSLSTDPRTLLCKRGIEDFHRAKIVKFVSFTGAFTGKYDVKSVKEVCETVHSTPKETCQHATQFDQPCKTACFWWVKETAKDAQECDLGLCKFVGYFHVFPSSYLRRRKGHAINFPHLLLW